MQNGLFIHADEISKELGVSIAYAYKLVRQLNAELAKQGFLTISGRVSRSYFNEKIYSQPAGGKEKRNGSV